MMKRIIAGFGLRVAMAGVAGGLAGGLGGCIDPLPGAVKAEVSESAAVALLQASAEAHGGNARFASISTITVDYEGQWLNKVWKLQPELVDRGYRQTSREWIVYPGFAGVNDPYWPVVRQVHTGPAGEKLVQWPPGQGQSVAAGAAVHYKPKALDEDEDEDPSAEYPDSGPAVDDAVAREAAAMVAEAYRMFLTGPFYFTQRDRPAAGQIAPQITKSQASIRSIRLDLPLDEKRGISRLTAVMSEPTVVQGAACDQVLVELRPGLGVSPVDRVQIAIDRQTQYVRRVRFSLDGFRETANATADVEMSGFTTVDGIVFPTEFLEIVVHPITREVHRWEATNIGVARDEMP